jgi:UDP-N-acetyl-D-mannosaminuronic acid dehydrogenase
MHYDICIVGGAGHVGLPLAISFAEKGQRVLIHDINEQAMAMISKGQMPFMERGADAILKDVLAKGRLGFSRRVQDVGQATCLIITIGTPVDEFLNPSLSLLASCFNDLVPYLRNEQLIVLRSTVYPGVTEWLGKFLDEHKLECAVSFCPERIIQGYAIEELKSLPQLVSGLSKEAEDRAAKLFELIAPEVVRTTPKEAELGKLFANAFRYIQFAVSNQFYMICSSAGLDYHRILDAVQHNYPRMLQLPRAGFTAGPCLFKDTVQLSAFCNDQFTIGHQAMLVNEGIPRFLMNQMREQFNLRESTIGLLGMAFKPESDDRRSSLSYKMKKILVPEAKQVLTTDPFVCDDPEIRPLDEVLSRSDILVLCAPHKVYKDIDVTGRKVVDVWNFWPAP